MDHVVLGSGKSGQMAVSFPPLGQNVVMRQIKEMPSSVNTARIFRLPPGHVLVKSAAGAVLSSASLGQAISSVKLSQATEPPTLRGVSAGSSTTSKFILVKSASGNVLSTANLGQSISSVKLSQAREPPPLEGASAGSSTTSELVPSKPRPPPHIIALRPLISKNEACGQANKSSGPGTLQRSVETTSTGPGTVQRLVETTSTGRGTLQRSVETTSTGRGTLQRSVETTSTGPGTLHRIVETTSTGQDENPQPKPKPKPWCREPRPLWRSKEPIVMYSGCPPENLERRVKKKDLIPQSLPCPKKLDDILPKDFRYHISSFEELKTPETFKAEIRVNISKKEEALQWLRDFEDISGTNFRVVKTFKENSFRVIFKKCLKCHKNTYRKGQVRLRESKRHVGCEARLTITVKNTEMKSSCDLLLAEFPCVIGIYHNHCHSLTTPDALRYRRPLPEVKEKFANMFQAKISPSAALKVHMADLKRQYGEMYSNVIQDGAKCPRLPWCYRLYYEIVGRKVKEGKKKSTRKSSYKKKTVAPKNMDSQTLQESTPENYVRNSYSVNNIIAKTECDEMQTSINSLYEYDFMSKNNEATEHELAGGVTMTNIAENHVNLTENSIGTVTSHAVSTANSLNSNEILENDEDYIDNSEILDTGESVGEYETTYETLHHVSNQNDETSPSEQSTSTSASATEMEKVAQGLRNVMDDISMRLKNQPDKYLPSVQKFLSEYSKASQTNSDSGILIAALNEFGSNLSKVMNRKPLESEVSAIVEGLIDQNQPSQSVTAAKPQHSRPQKSGSPKRKVLVLRMDPNKFNQIIQKVGTKTSPKELVNV